MNKTILTIILSILLIASLGYIAYDKIYEQQKSIATINDNEDSSRIDENCNNQLENKENADTNYQAKSSVSTTEILSYYKERISSYRDVDSYGISDINGDKIPELFIYYEAMSGNRITASTDIYTYDENSGLKNSNYIVHLGTISGRYAVWYQMNDGTLMMVSAHMGAESTMTFKLENNWLVKINSTYKENVENYSTGDVHIPFKACNDLSLLNNYQ